MMHLKNQSGVTLIEIVIVIVILGIIASMSSSLLTQGLDSYARSENIVDANWQGQIALQQMSRQIRLIRSPADITSATASNLAFTNIDNNTIAFSLSGTSLMLTLNGNSSILADGVQSLAFTYFDKTGAVTATLSSIRYIRISFNITQKTANYTLTAAIYPRNLP